MRLFHARIDAGENQAVTAQLFSAAEIALLTDWRRRLHQAPEISGQEAATAQAVRDFLADTRPDATISDLGGHGVALVYAGAQPGPTAMIRCELDGLPIEELGRPAHASRIPGKGHMCGHDGHMAIVAAVARAFGRQRPARGRAVMLLQPAEETGAGPAAVLADPQFAAIRPDWAFSLHNMPGMALGAAAIAAGAANCASRGMRIVLRGKTAHASDPATGISPAPALARLVTALSALGTGGAVDADFRLATITHARLGEPTFGVAPGYAELWTTLRSLTDCAMQAMTAAAEAEAEAAAKTAGLALEIAYHDDFAACVNDAQAAARLSAAIAAEGLPLSADGFPMCWSEDFGRFGAVAKSAMFLLGAGERAPALHNPDYDFPDALIEPGARALHRVLRDLLG